MHLLRPPVQLGFGHPKTTWRCLAWVLETAQSQLHFFSKHHCKAPRIKFTETKVGLSDSWKPFPSYSVIDISGSRGRISIHPSKCLDHWGGPADSRACQRSRAGAWEWRAHSRRALSEWAVLFPLHPHIVYNSLSLTIIGSSFLMFIDKERVKSWKGVDETCKSVGFSSLCLDVKAELIRADRSLAAAHLTVLILTLINTPHWPKKDSVSHFPDAALNFMFITEVPQRSPLIFIIYPDFG